MKDASPQFDDLALWRYGIIAPLLHRNDESPPLYREMSALSRRPYFTPDGRMKSVSADTLRLWLWRYRQMGLAGLQNKVRRDRGRSRVPEPLREALFSLRKTHPLYTVKRLLIELLEQDLWNGRMPSRTALYRFTAANNLNRKVLETEASARPFEFRFFGDLWIGDFLHGPKVKEGVRARKSYLHAIIDDATRYVVAANFYLAENTESMLSDLMLAIRRFGIARRYYTDNGSAYRSRHLKFVAAKLGMALPHTPPYKPRGRGKGERFFRTLRDGLLTGRSRTTLKKLNQELAAWIDAYHHRVHSSLGMSPLNRKLADKGPPLAQIDPVQNINDIFRMETKKIVHQDGCVRLWGRRFEIKDACPGENIMIYYLPWNKEYILCGPDKLVARPVDTHKNAHRFNKPVRGKRNNNQEEK